MVFAKELKIGDIVTYKNRFPFGDMRVTYKDDKGIDLLRPYLSSSNEAGTEHIWFAIDSNFQFQMVQPWQGY